MQDKILKLDVGGVPEQGGVFFPVKDRDGNISFNTEEHISVAPGEELPDPPAGYDNWIQIPSLYVIKKEKSHEK